MNHDPLKILTDNILLTPGLSLVGPLLGSPEQPTVAVVGYWAIILISGAVYGVPITIVWTMLRQKSISGS